MDQLNTMEQRTCRECDALCCRYVATGIDRPVCKRDYDHIRWYLMHRNVFVFVDHEGEWYLEFATDCTRLGTSGECLRYEERPRICRQHGAGAVECEFKGDHSPYRLRFSSPEDFEAYLHQRKIDWRWKS